MFTSVGNQQILILIAKLFLITLMHSKSLKHFLYTTQCNSPLK